MENNENNKIDPDELHYKTDYDLIPYEELDHIHPDHDKTFPSPTMKSGIMAIHHNDPEHIIDDPEDFCQYLS